MRALKLLHTAKWVKDSNRYPGPPNDGKSDLAGGINSSDSAAKGGGEKQKNMLPLCVRGLPLFSPGLC